MKDSIVFVTGNVHKIREVTRQLEGIVSFETKDLGCRIKSA